MSKFEIYNINLKDLKSDTTRFEFVLDDVYFKKIDSPEVQKGNVTAKVNVVKRTATFELQFELEGVVLIPCDRCLDDMEQNIQYKDKLQVKFGSRFAEENEIVIVPESEGSINIAWFLYEFIVLNIPMKHVHAPGECNKTMVTKLKKHITRQKDDDEDDSLVDIDEEDDFSNDDMQMDPRWEGLQNLIDNN